MELWIIGYLLLVIIYPLYKAIPQNANLDTRVYFCSTCTTFLVITVINKVAIAAKMKVAVMPKKAIIGMERSSIKTRPRFKAIVLSTVYSSI